MKNSLKRVTTRASYSDWRFCSEHCCLHSVILSGQDRIYQDILASGGVTQLGADLAESRLYCYKTQLTSTALHTSVEF